MMMMLQFYWYLFYLVHFHQSQNLSRLLSSLASGPISSIKCAIFIFALPLSLI